MEFKSINNDDILKIKLYKALIHVVNFAIGFITFVCELVRAFDYISIFLGTSEFQNNNPFILYLTSFLSFFVNEMIYDQSSNVTARRFLQFSSSVGCLASLAYIAVNPLLFKYTDVITLISFIITIIIILCYLFAAIAFLIKMFSAWNQSDNQCKKDNVFRIDKVDEYCK